MKGSITPCTLCGDPQRSHICYWCRRHMRQTMGMTPREQISYLRLIRGGRYSPRVWMKECGM